MVRFISLGLLVVACLAAAPAQAEVLPAGAQAPAVAQHPAGAVTAVPEAATAVTASAVRHVGANAPTTDEPAADPTVRTAADLAQPATKTAGYTTASVVSPQADGSGSHVSSGRPGASARFRSSGRSPAGWRAAHRETGATLPYSHGSAPGATTDAAPRATGGASDQQPAAPERGPRAGAAGAPAGSGSFLFGGMALLAAAVCLAGPRLCRRLSIRPGAFAPVAFVSLPERPG
jgi:hypothetical protein